MITLHSIDLKTTTEPCFAEIGRSNNKNCRLLYKMGKDCGSYKCPFYKPRDCKDWVRVEDRLGVSIVPPEEYYRYRRRQI